MRNDNDTMGRTLPPDDSPYSTPWVSPKPDMIDPFGEEANPWRTPPGKPAAAPTISAPATTPSINKVKEKTPKGWADKDIRDEYLRPALSFIGGPKRLGVAAGLLAGIPFYLFAKKNKLELPWLRTLGMFAVAGGAAYGLSRAPGVNTTTGWVNRLIGAPKTASDFIHRGDLFDAVADLPGYNDTQKNFLALGAAAAPGNDAITLSELSRGYSDVTGAVTGGLLPMATRALEGALIGSAFGALIGVQPNTRHWMAGIGAVADALYGNQLINRVGSMY